MPCPYFEPTQVAGDPQSAFGRLPLIAEYNGVCHRDGSAIKGRSPLRFEGCNQGRWHAECPHNNQMDSRVSRRFTVRARTETTLVVLVLEEVDHAPVRWREVVYLPAENAFTELIDSAAESAQIRAFCASYLQTASSPSLNPNA